MTDIIYVLRHGETDWNAVGRLQGQTDIPLNDQGREQAKSIAPFIATLDIEACYASDLARAYETAQLALAQHPTIQQLIPYPPLRERNFGIMNGHTDAENNLHKKENPHLYIDLDGKGRLFPKDGEHDSIFVARVTDTFTTLRAKHEKPILLVTHGGIIRQLMRSYMPHIEVFQPGNCVLYRLTPHNDHWDMQAVIFSSAKTVTG